MTADTLREARSELRRWCQEGGFHFDVDDVSCPGANCYAHGNRHRGRVRRMLVCSVCEQGYFSRKEFDAHECHSAY